jgi:hypothetical protein
MASTIVGESNKTSTYDRFLDVDKEPKKMLQPIEGYQKLPIVSLEIAVESIIPFCPDILRRVHIAKSNCTQPADNLTCDESAAVYLYTLDWLPPSECLYVVLNATLRTENRHKLKPWFLYLKLFLTALDKIHSHSRSVWRGVRLDLRQEYELDKLYTWWAFSSCTEQLSVLECDHLLGRTGKRTLFHIECENGKKISPHSYIPSELEILLLPATQFIVKSIVQPSTADPDLTIIELKEVKPKFPLLERPN